MNAFAQTIGKITLFLIAAFAWAMLLCWPFLLLWNGCIVGTIEGVGPLESVWHAWGVLILSGIFFRGVSTSK